MPPLIDWGWLKPRMEAHLAALSGMPARIDGEVSVRLLPRLSATAERLSLGAPGDAASARIGRMAFSAPLAGLMRGQPRIEALALDDVEIAARPGHGHGLRLPSPTLPEGFALDGAMITRGRLIIHADGGVVRLPLALTVSAAAAAGPWRVEGEIAGEPVRFVTGVAEAGGDAPMRLVSETATRRIEIDGAVGIARAEGLARLRWEGQAQLIVKGGSAQAPPAPAPPGQAPPVLAATLRGRLAGDALDMTSLALDLGEAGRLEGEGRWLSASNAAELRLGARRLVADGLPGTGAALRVFLGGRPGLILPSRVDARLSVDQLIWRGEEFADSSASFRLDAEGLTAGEARASLAGLSLGLAQGRWSASGAVGGRLSARAAALQRPALALARMGLPATVADSLSGLGALDAGLDVSRLADGAAWRLADIALVTPGGEARGAVELTGEALSITARLRGVDLAQQAEAVAALAPAGLEGRRLALDMAGEGVRLGGGAPGEFVFRGVAEAGRWRVDALTASGFGGLTLARRDGLVRLSAPDAASLAALLGPGLADAASSLLRQRAGSLSPLDLALVLDPSSATPVWRAEGRLGAGFAARLSGTFDGPAPRLTQAHLEGGGAQVLGLVSPAALTLAQLREALLPERATLDLDLAADGGVRVALSGEALSASWQAAMQANGALSGPLRAKLGGGQPLDLAARLELDSERTALHEAAGVAAGRAFSGAASRSRGEAWQGALTLEEIGPADLAALGLGLAPASAGEGWSTQRFAPAPALPRLDLMVQAARAPLGPVLVARNLTTRLVSDDGALRLTGVTAELAGGRISGEARLGHQGGLRSLGWNLALEGADAALLTGGALTGRMELRLDGGGAGETPQRLVNSLSGAGEAKVSAAAIPRLAPDALAKLIAEADEAAQNQRSDARLAALIAESDWPLGEAGAPLTLSGGVLRAGPLASRHGATDLRISPQFDLRNWRLDASATLALGGVARPGEPLPQAVVTWRGAPGAIQRTVEGTALRNLLAARDLRRELDRIETFEADARERAFHARRLRQEREAREREAREREARLREEAERARRAPPLPPPLVISPIPAPAPASRAP